MVRQNSYQPDRTDAQAPRRVRVHVHDQPRQQRPLHQPSPLPVGTSWRFALPRWPAYVGLAGVLMVGGWLGIGALSQGWQTWQDDVHYGRPRTYQTDAVVGHNHDTSATPSHFIVLNLHGQITVIELPAGDLVHNYETFSERTRCGS
ncbi:hypothetical protein [Ktedonobacter racemifer]|uniref:hypothetical protein n=1 Tax=Ktedonobacter racemifer TaxID=363277 RepID=UPI001FCB4E51|nr:hypothetical protein [Ktedonobacter racemifer]